MEIIKGIGSSQGISIEKVFVFKKEKLNISKINITKSKEEINFFNESKKKAENQLNNLKNNLKKKSLNSKAQIFDAQIEILNDPDLSSKVIEKIKRDKLNASYCLQEVANNFIQTFEKMEDEYMRERSIDIKDVTNRLLEIMENINSSDISSINKNVIIIADDLTPSETSQINKKYVKGIILKEGGKTSHTSIIARTLEIPAVVGIGEQISKIRNGSRVIIDGYNGEVVYKFTDEIEMFYLEKIKRIEKEKNLSKKYINKKTLTKDGFKLKLTGNISSNFDMEFYKNYGSEGVGLFRTEFLYMNSKNWPSEETQYEEYREVLEIVGKNKTTIRTLDIGGDKHLDYYKFEKEENPFLGNRAIRFQLENTNILEAQLRAMLRASKFGKLSICISMISNIDEIIKVKKIISKIEQEFKERDIKIGKYKLGIMVEVPSVIDLIEKFVKYVDFFSIGTNDLIQYTFAVDRMSKKLSHLYQVYNPIIFKKIKKIIDVAHKNKKTVSICGEMSSDKRALPLLIGLNIDELSMPLPSILETRKLISKLNSRKCKKLVNKVIEFETQENVLKEINSFYESEKIKI